MAADRIDVLDFEGMTEEEAIHAARKAAGCYECDSVLCPIHPEFEGEASITEMLRAAAHSDEGHKYPNLDSLPISPDVKKRIEAEVRERYADDPEMIEQILHGEGGGFVMNLLPAGGGKDEPDSTASYIEGIEKGFLKLLDGTEEAANNYAEMCEEAAELKAKSVMTEAEIEERRAKLLKELLDSGNLGSNDITRKINMEAAIHDDEVLSALLSLKAEVDAMLAIAELSLDAGRRSLSAHMTAMSARVEQAKVMIELSGLAKH